jgi:hypothetical protein
MAYHEADLGRVRTVPVGSRRNKVDPTLLATPPGDDRSFPPSSTASPTSSPPVT